ncbi:MAG: hypothetical protein QXH03_09325, partial [Candidatus Bathyarchaeia archaeon]
GVKEVRIVALTLHLTSKGGIKVIAHSSSVQIQLDKAKSMWILVEGKSRESSEMPILLYLKR